MDLSQEAVLESFNPHPEIREAVGRVCARFPMSYWLECEEKEQLATEFFEAMRADGWLGIFMPAEYGGVGLGITAASVMLQTIGEHGGGWTASGAVQPYVFAPHALVKHGNAEQKERILRPLIKGDTRMCLAVTEPDTGLDTTHLKTRAVLQGDHYIMNGEKVWITAANFADYMMIIARTTPISDTAKPVDGLSLFCTRIDRKYVETINIKKHGFQSIPSCQVFIRDLPIPKEDLIGEEGKGFRYLIDSINPERIHVAATAIGMGRYAIQRASQYANERVVFGRKIGQNQSIQHPLAECWMELEAANLMTFKAAALYDAGLPCAAEANTAKFLAARAAHKACMQAVVTHGGFGYAKDFHLERQLREIMIPLLAPVGQNLTLSYVAERVLNLPRSY
jgi:acyl-CoA dehydrogenase